MAEAMKVKWLWVVLSLLLAVAGVAIVRHEDRSAARAVTEQAARQAATYDSALAAADVRDAISRGTIASLRAAADTAAQAALEAKARTSAATERLAKLGRPAETDSTNPAWHRIALAQQDIIAGQAAQIANLSTEITKLDVSYRTDSARAAAWEVLAVAGKVTIDSLRTEVHVAALGSEVCSFLTVRCPSRTKLVLLTALATGTVVILATKR